MKNQTKTKYSRKTGSIPVVVFLKPTDERAVSFPALCLGGRYHRPNTLGACVRCGKAGAP